MQYYLLWPEGETRHVHLSTLLQIVYERGDHEELFHLISFLRSHFALTEKDLTEENLEANEERFPVVWLGENPVAFKRLVRVAGSDKEIRTPISFGLIGEDQPVFHAYKKYLDQDISMADGLKTFFSNIEKDFFGTKDVLN